jgi:putative CocE/NonD family hydrolase
MRRIGFLLLAALALPGAEKKYDVKIDFDQRVKMRDGVALSADVYRPDAEGKFPVILARTPYVKAAQLNNGKHFASHGYVYVAMDVRGRGDSDGKFVPYRNDGIDGYDAIEWCAAQPCSSGKVGTYGGSYLGRVQWLAAVQQPPHLVTMVALVTPSDPFVEWPTGVPLPMDVSWHHFTAGHVSQNMAAVDWAKVHSHLPLLTMDEAAGRPNPNWKEMFEHARLDAWWEPMRYQNKYERVRVPVLHISGWYDDEQVGTPLNYIGMTTRGPSGVRTQQKMLMGWWPHNTFIQETKLGDVDFGSGATFEREEYILRWFDHWLKGTDNGILREPPVKLFVMGENRWRDENEWPMVRTKFTRFYLHSQGRANSSYGDGSLSTAEPSSEPRDKYTYDPAQATPFITEPSFAQIGGPDDYRPIERRDDVLVYTTGPVTENTEVCGPVRVKLYAATSARDTDFMAKLIDVWPNGFAQRLTDGMVRARFRDGMEAPSLIEPGRVYAYDIDAWNTCQVFLKGHRIRLEIASSAFPKYDRNPNTGEPLGRTTKMQTAEQTVYHERGRESFVVLPVVPGN